MNDEVRSCTRCGAQLSIGRFCTNCGQPIAASGDLRTDTAERPAVPPVVEPLPAHEPPPPARFPLFVDDEQPAAPTSGPRRRWGLLAAGACGVALLLALPLAWIGGSDDEQPDAPATTASAEGASPSTSAPDGTATRSTDSSDRPSVDADRISGSPRDITSMVTASAPRHGPPSTDVVTGQQITYSADQMLDQNPATTWRTPGDATGMELRFTLPTGSILAQVSIVNGYAKTSKVGRRTYDWYLGNRRVTSVEWMFDDGTKVTQPLEETRKPQPIDLGAIQTASVTLKILAVSEPGTGIARKDNTAISEVDFTGWSS